jgi:hypothetical protein
VQQLDHGVNERLARIAGDQDIRIAGRTQTIDSRVLR